MGENMSRPPEVDDDGEADVGGGSSNPVAQAVNRQRSLPDADEPDSSPRTQEPPRRSQLWMDDEEEEDVRPSRQRSDRSQRSRDRDRDHDREPSEEPSASTRRTERRRYEDSSPSSPSPDDNEPPVRVQSLDDCEEYLTECQKLTVFLQRHVDSHREKVATARASGTRHEPSKKFIRVMSRKIRRLRKVHKALIRFFDAGTMRSQSGTSGLRFSALKRDFGRLKKDSQAVLNLEEVSQVEILAQTTPGTRKKSRTQRDVERSQRRRDRDRDRERRRGRNTDGDVMEEERGGGGRTQAQAQREKRMRLTYETAMTIDVERRIAEEQREDLIGLDTQMNEVVEMTQEMSHLVDEGQVLIDGIGDHIEASIEHVNTGRKHIRSARGMQKMGLGRIVAGGLIRKAL